MDQRAADELIRVMCGHKNKPKREVDYCPVCHEAYMGSEQPCVDCEARAKDGQ